MDLCRAPLSPLSGALVCALFFMLLTGLATNNDRILSGDPYSYDEADYMYAAQKGFVANYTDQGSIAMSAFLAKGMKAGFTRSEWGRLSKFIRSSDDITFYRHFHGPLYFYWLGIMNRLGFDTEQQIRHTNLFLLFLLGLSFGTFLGMVLPGRPLYLLAPVIALLFFGPSMILTFNHLTPHGLYMILAFTTLGLLSVYCRSRAPRYWYIAVVTASLALLTLEYAAVLVLTMAVTLWLFRKSHLASMPPRSRRRFFIITALCFFVPILILWPGGLIKLTIVKNYLFYFYFTLIRGDLYGSFSAWQVWTMRITESPLEYLALAGSIAAAAILFRKNRWMLPPALYASLIFLTCLRNQSTFPQYFTSAFPALYLLGGTGWAALTVKKSGTIRFAATLLAILGIATNSAVFYSRWAQHSWQRMPHQITSLSGIAPLLAENNIPIFINRDYIPTVHYYFPGSRLNPFNPAFETRESVIEMASDFLRTRGGAVLLFLDREHEDLSALLDARFTVEKRRNVYLSPSAANAVCFRLSLKQG